MTSGEGLLGMGKAVIFTGGAAPRKEIYEHECSDAHLLIAADSGIDTALEHGFIPQYLIGDSDSLTKKIPPQVHVIPHSVDKDETDTQLAFELAEQKGGDTIILIGGGEGRMDHLLSLWAQYERDTWARRWYTAHECVYQITDRIILSDISPHSYISLTTLGSDEVRLITKGLAWELEDFPLTHAHQSISNRAVEKTVHIRITSGKAAYLMITYSPDSPYLPSISR